MHHILFDIDGTLIESTDIDTLCFQKAVEQVTGITISTDWASYQHVTDTGIAKEIASKNGISEEERTIQMIKQAFLSSLQKTIEQNPIKEIPGAKHFLDELKKKKNLIISFATGGWLESALMKLRSAGISPHDIHIASSNDHYKRVNIMKAAQSHLQEQHITQSTYFGDGIWDKTACEILQFDFIAVGTSVDHHMSIRNFLNHSYIFSLLGIGKTSN